MDSALRQLKTSEQALLTAFSDAGVDVDGDLNHIRSPWRKDANGSISIYEHEGIWRWKDHGSKDSGTIVDVVAKNLGVSDQEAVKIVLARYGSRTTETMGRRRKHRGKGFGSVSEIERYLESKKLCKCSQRYEYRDADNNLCLVVVRLDYPDGRKEFRPASRMESGGWRLKGPDGPALLFNLPELLARPQATVVVVEGEKCAEALIEFLSDEFVVTTSAFGSKSPQKTDWSPLLGRDVIFWPDNDKPGQAYVQKVAEILREQEVSP